MPYIRKRSHLTGRDISVWLPRHCVYCGMTWPRTVVPGGWAHKRCIPLSPLPGKRRGRVSHSVKMAQLEQHAAGMRARNTFPIQQREQATERWKQQKAAGISGRGLVAAAELVAKARKGAV